MRSIFRVILIYIVVIQAFLFSEGNLLIIGGALKDNNSSIYLKMIELGGGKGNVRVAIISGASAYPSDTGRKTKKVFISYGVKGENIRVFPIALIDDPTTKDKDESEWIENPLNDKITSELLEYNLVFISGGDQSRLGDLLIRENGEDTPVLDAVRNIYKRGGTIAGTSAGAAVMSDPMITSGSSISAVTGELAREKQGNESTDALLTRKGFGLIRGVLIDQHFIKRGRIGRLITALAKNRDKVTKGIGVDEDTALLVKDGICSVIGSSGVLLCDISKAILKLSENGLTASGVRIDYLHSGDKISLLSQEFSILSDRKEIHPGMEYYKNYQNSTDIFGKDVFRDILTLGLADNKNKKISGIGFTIKSIINPGTRLTLSKVSDTRSFMGKINGEYTYSVINAILIIEPIRVTVENCKK